MRSPTSVSSRRGCRLTLDGRRGHSPISTDEPSPRIWSRKGDIVIKWPEHFSPEPRAGPRGQRADDPGPLRAGLGVADPGAAMADLVPELERCPAASISPQSELRLGTMFTWRTFGVKLKSTVQEFVPQERLAWTARGIGVDAYHAWLLLPRSSGTHVDHRRDPVRSAGAAAKNLHARPHETRRTSSGSRNLSAKAQGGCAQWPIARTCARTDIDHGN